MGTDIVTTLLNALVIEEGLVMSEHFIRDLTISYLQVADNLIRMYSDNAAFCSLTYDAEVEEELVNDIFKFTIIYAGDLLLTPYRMVDRFSSFVTSHEAFKPYLEQGLLDAIQRTGERARNQLYETPHTVSWERVTRKLPRIFYDIIDVVEQEKRLYA
jgi:glucosyl-3-phosphoglycerate synthase